MLEKSKVIDLNQQLYNDTFLHDHNNIKQLYVSQNNEYLAILNENLYLGDFERDYDHDIDYEIDHKSYSIVVVEKSTSNYYYYFIGYGDERDFFWRPELMCFTNDSNHIIFPETFCRICIWNFLTDEMKYLPITVTDPNTKIKGMGISSLCVSLNNQYIVAGYRYRKNKNFNVQIYNNTSQNIVDTMNVYQNTNIKDEGITLLKFCENNQNICIGSYDLCLITIYDIVNKIGLKNLNYSRIFTSFYSISPNGKYILCVKKNKFFILNIQKKTERYYELPNQIRGFKSRYFNNDGEYFAGISFNDEIIISKTNTGEILTIKDHSNLDKVCFGNNQDYIVTLDSKNNSCTIWNINKKEFNFKKRKWLLLMMFDSAKKFKGNKVPENAYHKVIQINNLVRYISQWL